MVGVGQADAPRASWPSDRRPVRGDEIAGGAPWRHASRGRAPDDSSYCARTGAQGSPDASGGGGSRTPDSTSRARSRPRFQPHTVRSSSSSCWRARSPSTHAATRSRQPSLDDRGGVRRQRREVVQVEPAGVLVAVDVALGDPGVGVEHGEAEQRDGAGHQGEPRRRQAPGAEHPGDHDGETTRPSQPSKTSTTRRSVVKP